MRSLLADPPADHPAVRQLSGQLADFYASTDQYDAFMATPDHTAIYAAMNPLLDTLSSAGKSIRVLELGAGRSGYGNYISQRRRDVRYEAQGVTSTNYGYLAERAHAVHVKDVSAIEGRYDLIFSTYVLEHVVTPHRYHEHIDRLLSGGGYHVIVSPRYDMLGYICPSIRHLSKASQWQHSAALVVSRLRNRVDGRERFWLNLDPALLHTSRWFRDSDAVHLVGRADLLNWHRNRGYRVSDLPIDERTIGRRLLSRMTRLALVCQKPSHVEAPV